MKLLPPPDSVRGVFKISARIYSTFFPSFQIDKAGPSRPLIPDNESIIEEVSQSDTESEEPPSKKLRLVSDLPEAQFLEKFMIVPDSKLKKRKIPVVLPKKDKPEWLEKLGELSYRNELWNLEIPDILVAHVAGCLASKPKEFSVSSEATLLSESFSLISFKLNSPPNFIKIRTHFIYDLIRHQVKSLTYQWATALLLHKQEVMNHEYLEHMVYPGVAEAILALEASVRQSRHLALPSKTAKMLRYKFINAPIDKLWPDDEKLLEDINKFFRDQRYRAARSGNFRGSNRGSRGYGYRGFSQRGMQRGQRAKRSRGQRGRGISTNSSSSQPSNNA